MSEEKEDRILRLLEQIDIRLQRLERTLGSNPLVHREREREVEREPIPASTPAPPPVRLAPPHPSAESAPRPEQKPDDTETTALVLGYIAIAALFVGLAYFLHWAVLSGVLSPIAAVLSGVGCGLALMAVGEMARGPYARFGHLLHGGGLALVYVALYVGWLRYEALSDVQGITATSAVTAVAMALAVWRNAVLTAVLASVGGYTTTLLIGLAEGQEIVFLTYLLVLNAGVLGVSLRQRWPGFTLGALFAACVCLAGHLLPRFTHEVTPLDATMLAYLTFYFFEFVAAASIPVVRKAEGTRDVEVTVFFVATAAYYAGCWLLVFAKDEWRVWLGAFTFCLALLLYFVSWLLRESSGESEGLSLLAKGLSLALFTAAIPIQFSGAVPAVLWAAEACALLWSGLREERARIRLAALSIATLTVLRVLVVDSSLTWHPWFNDRLVAYLAGISMCAFFAVTFRRYQQAVIYEKVLPVAFGVSACALGIIASSLEVWDYFIVLRKDPLMAQAMLSIVWAVWGMAIVIYGASRMSPAARWSGLALFGLAASKLLLADLPKMGEGYLALSFIGIGVLLLVAAWFYFRSAIRAKGSGTGATS